MSEPSETPERLLESPAKEALDELVDEFREFLLKRAGLRAAGGPISENDVHAAFKQLGLFSKDSLQFSDAQAVISQALKENRIVEWVSYVMAVILFVFGLVLLSMGALGGDVATRVGCLLGGSIVELLILVPFRFAINSRRHNIALRMLGLIINRVDDPKKLASLLKDTFLTVVVGTPQFKVTSEP